MKGLRTLCILSFLFGFFFCFFSFTTNAYGAGGAFLFKLYDNTTLSGTPLQTATVDAIATTPATHVGPFSATWTGTIPVPKDALYQFEVSARDGVRIFIDGSPAVSHWRTQNGYDAFTQFLLAGSHSIRVEYFQQGTEGHEYVVWRLLPNGKASDARAIDNSFIPPSQPTDPTIPTNPGSSSNISFSFTGNPPRLSDGSVNVKELNTVINDLHQSSYVFFPQHTASKYPDDYTNSFTDILSSTNVPIYLDLLGFNHKSVRPDYQDYVQWGSDAATLSRTYSNLKGMILDDFYGASGSNTFSDPSYIKRIHDAVITQNSNFKLYATLYCTPDKADVTKFTRDASAQYITGVYLYTHPSYTNGGVSQPEKMIDSCISSLKAAGKQVVEGVYLDDLENYAVTDAVFKKNISVALKTHPDSFVLYEMQPRQAPGSFNRYEYIRTAFAGSSNTNTTPPIYNPSGGGHSNSTVVVFATGGNMTPAETASLQSQIQTFYTHNMPAGTPFLTVSYNQNIANIIRTQYPGKKIILLGHSFGGNAMVTAAASLGTPVEFLMLFDPVHIANPAQASDFIIPSNVKKAVAYRRQYVDGVPASGLIANPRPQDQNIIYPEDASRRSDQNYILEMHGYAVWLKTNFDFINTALAQ